MSFRDLQQEISAEFDEASGRGAGEWFDAEGFGFRRLPKIRDNDFAKLCNSLRAAKWNREHPERRREIANAYARKPDVRARAADLAKQRRAKAAEGAPAYLCKECRKTFRRKRRGPAPEFCGDACRQRFRYQQRTPGARRCLRADEVPTTCREPDCGGKHYAKGKCRKHWLRDWSAARRTP